MPTILSRHTKSNTNYRPLSSAICRNTVRYAGGLRMLRCRKLPLWYHCSVVRTRGLCERRLLKSNEYYIMFCYHPHVLTCFECTFQSGNFGSQEFIFKSERDINVLPFVKKIRRLIRPTCHFLNKVTDLYKPRYEPYVYWTVHHLDS